VRAKTQDMSENESCMLNKRLGNIKHTLLKLGFNVIEEYSDDPRGVSCLLLCFSDDMPVHMYS
jgi:hypothetical protein